jgi:hypothetical protein
MKFGTGDLYRNLWGKDECCETLLIDSNTSFMGISWLIPILSIFINQFE